MATGPNRPSRQANLESLAAKVLAANKPIGAAAASLEIAAKRAQALEEAMGGTAVSSEDFEKNLKEAYKEAHKLGQKAREIGKSFKEGLAETGTNLVTMKGQLSRVKESVEGYTDSIKGQLTISRAWGLMVEGQTAGLSTMYKMLSGLPKSIDEVGDITDKAMSKGAEVLSNASAAAADFNRDIEETRRLAKEVLMKFPRTAAAEIDTLTRSIIAFSIRTGVDQAKAVELTSDLVYRYGMNAGEAANTLATMTRMVELNTSANAKNQPWIDDILNLTTDLVKETGAYNANVNILTGTMTAAARKGLELNMTYEQSLKFAKGVGEVLTTNSDLFRVTIGKNLLESLKVNEAMIDSWKATGDIGDEQAGQLHEIMAGVRSGMVNEYQAGPAIHDIMRNTGVSMKGVLDMLAKSGLSSGLVLKSLFPQLSDTDSIMLSMEIKTGKMADALARVEKNAGKTEGALVDLTATGKEIGGKGGSFLGMPVEKWERKINSVLTNPKFVAVASILSPSVLRIAGMLGGKAAEKIGMGVGKGAGEGAADAVCDAASSCAAGGGGGMGIADMAIGGVAGTALKGAASLVLPLLTNPIVLAAIAATAGVVLGGIAIKDLVDHWGEVTDWWDRNNVVDKDLYSGLPSENAATMAFGASSSGYSTPGSREAFFAPKTPTLVDLPGHSVHMFNPTEPKIMKAPAPSPAPVMPARGGGTTGAASVLGDAVIDLDGSLIVKNIKINNFMSAITGADKATGAGRRGGHS